MEKDIEIMRPTDEFKHGCLEALADQLAIATYPGYPSLRERLWQDGNLQFLDTERVMLPHGPWETSAGAVPTIPEQMAFREHGQVDFYGRPLHPWFDAMLHDARIGVVTGKGFFRRWGPNYTADSIVFRHDLDEPHLLLIRRKDNGTMALPGGFLDEGEDPLVAAQRETLEEAGLDLTQYAIDGQAVYFGPLGDWRLTANAWPETHAYRFDLPAVPGEIRAGDDAIGAEWVALSALAERLRGSHALLVQQALLLPAATPS